MREVIDQLVDCGHSVTHDWTRTDEFDKHGNPVVNIQAAGTELNKKRQRKYASDDLQGVKDADVFVMMADDNGLIGTYIELGAALAEGIDVIVCKPARKSIFYTLPNVQIVDSDEEILTAIAALEGQRVPV